MKRVQYDRHGGPEKYYVGEHDLPEPAPGEVRVAVRAAAVNPLDWKLRDGAMKMMTGRRFPKGVGTDFAGVVEHLGPGVTGFSIGEEVFGTLDFRRSGAFADAVNVAISNIARKPAEVSFAQAAALPIAATTAWAALLDRASTRSGSRVFINGCSGAVGSMAVQLAVAQGARVSGACGPGSKNAAVSAGVSTVFDYGDQGLYSRTGQFDVVFDTLGTMPVGKGVSLLKPGGVFVDINPTPGRFLRGLVSRRYKVAFATMGTKYLPEIAGLAGRGVLRAMIGAEVPFNEALRALKAAEVGPKPNGKTVLLF